MTIDRRKFLQQGALLGTAFALMGPLHALGVRATAGLPRKQTLGYGPLVNKGDLWLPAAFNYQVLSVQGKPMSDGRLTPGIFDGMAAFPGQAGTTILIRNHENRELAGEMKVITTPLLEYDETAFGGNTKLEVRREQAGIDPATGQPLYAYEVVRDFAILGGTSTNCAGGIRKPHIWISCEEVVKRSSNGRRHGYIFEIDARSEGPVAAIPVPQAGRMAHEAACERAGIIYLTEDRAISADPLTRQGLLGSCFYRYLPEPRGLFVPLAQTSGPLQALKLRDEFHANLDAGRTVGIAYPVEWVTIDEPDHEDDTDNRRDRLTTLTPTRVQAQDKGAAFFDRLEGMWVGPGKSKIYFTATTGGAQNLGQVWEYDAGREVLTLIYESSDPTLLQNPDNIVIAPQTGDIFLQEDSQGEQHVRGITRDGRIYDFARTTTNHSEFCGGCFDPDGQTFYLNQQGGRGSEPAGPAGGGAVTYAIYGPFSATFRKRFGRTGKNFSAGK